MSLNEYRRIINTNG